MLETYVSFFDPYAYEVAKLDNPASNLILLVADDSVLPVGVKGLRIWNPGVSAADIVVTTLVGDLISFKVPPSSLWVEPLRIRKLMAATTGGVIVHGYTDRAHNLSELPLDA